MGQSRYLSNDYQDFRLLSLSKKGPYQDQHGPYIIIQEGADPNDDAQRSCTFVLTRRGTWIHYYVFLMLPKDIRYKTAVLESVPDVIQLAERLPHPVTVETIESLKDLLNESGYVPQVEDSTSRVLLEELARKPSPRQEQHWK